MKKCTLDTNIITAFLKNNSRVVKKIENYLKDFDKLSINIISYYEILRGLKDIGNIEKVERFEEFIKENELIFFKKQTIQKAAEIYVSLKKEGKLIDDADILIAAIAIIEDLILITNNINHFKRIHGLQLENWL